MSTTTKREQAAAYDALVAELEASGVPHDIAEQVARSIIYGESFDDVVIEGEAADESE